MISSHFLHKKCEECGKAADGFFRDYEEDSSRHTKTWLCTDCARQTPNEELFIRIYEPDYD